MDGFGGFGIAAKIAGLWPKGWGDARSSGDGKRAPGDDPREAALREQGFGPAKLSPDDPATIEEPNFLGRLLGMQPHAYNEYGDELPYQPDYASEVAGVEPTPPGIATRGDGYGGFFDNTGERVPSSTASPWLRANNGGGWG
jgi:hypothetical protein